ncbi:glutamine synthetase [Penicillium citrinum]|uniref:Glutamine synthetase n=1 Tax=Penicillium citrinum TaxID=5077 RepID=A0A9W9PDL7_PENCI|nr:glutamine synthetase [Penicillium citrinum]KAJ5242475.1 glutamine synthetase [Penicillium citrinum]
MPHHHHHQISFPPAIEDHCTRNLPFTSSFDMHPNETKAFPLTAFFDQNPEVSLIRLQWQDYAGVMRAIVYPEATVIQFIAEGKPFEAVPAAMNHTVDGSVLPLTPHDGNHRFLPDWSSIRQTPDLKTATVICASEYVKPGAPTTRGLCPRQNLLAAKLHLEAELG